MTPHKQSGGRTYRIDRTMKGIGRIAMVSGTDDIGTHRQILAAITGLQKIGRTDLLAALRDGLFTPLQLLHRYQRGELHKLPTKPATPGGLLDAIRSWSTTHEASVSYRADLKGTVKRLASLNGIKTADVNDLADYLRVLKGQMRSAPVAFNRMRAHALAFASEVSGKHTELWNSVARINRYKKAEGVRPRKLLRRPLTVAELDAVCAAFVDYPVYGGKRGGGKTLRRSITAADLADMTYTLAFTGMRPAEYWQRNGASWESAIGHVRIRGTKTRAADRVTLDIGASYWPYCGEQFFRRAFAAATAKAIGVALDTYSLRRTFAALLESAQVEPSRARSYMGHGPKTVSDLYTQTNVLPFVAQDAERVSAFIRAERARTAARPSLTLETR